jgi:DNA invertase Pin-like site-specific DNA recombinase
MLIGYARVSKADGSQVLDLQRDALSAAGVPPERLYEDLASGRRDDRPGLTACLKALQPGNTLVLWKLDRLGRDLKHLVNTVDWLREHGDPPIPARRTQSRTHPGAGPEHAGRRPADLIHGIRVVSHIPG